MEENRIPETISYYAHEAEVMRHERDKKRLWIVLIVSLVVTAITNLGWVWYLNQYDFESTVTIDSKDGGNANYLGGNGDIVNGEDSRKTGESSQEQ